MLLYSPSRSAENVACENRAVLAAGGGGRMDGWMEVRECCLCSASTYNVIIVFRHRDLLVMVLARMDGRVLFCSAGIASSSSSSPSSLGCSYTLSGTGCEGRLGVCCCGQQDSINHRHGALVTAVRGGGSGWVEGCCWSQQGLTSSSRHCVVLARDWHERVRQKRWKITRFWSAKQR